MQGMRQETLQTGWPARCVRVQISRQQVRIVPLVPPFMVSPPFVIPRVQLKQDPIKICVAMSQSIVILNNMAPRAAVCQHCDINQKLLFRAFLGHLLQQPTFQPSVAPIQDHLTPSYGHGVLPVPDPAARFAFNQAGDLSCRNVLHVVEQVWACPQSPLMPANCLANPSACPFDTYGFQVAGLSYCKFDVPGMEA
eukprot:50240-Pelagomonas_calceolata.AAC.7